MFAEKIIFDLALMQYIVFFKSFSELGASLKLCIVYFNYKYKLVQCCEHYPNN